MLNVIVFCSRMTTDHIVRSGYLSEDLADSDAENVDDMYDENSSARLFERQRIKALSGKVAHLLKSIK